MPSVLLKGCDRCKGDMFKIEDEDGLRWNCLQCGAYKKLESITEMKEGKPLSIENINVALKIIGKQEYVYVERLNKHTLL